MIEEKILYFEYVIWKLIQWSCDMNSVDIIEFERENDFSKLKVLKLHFFLCAVKSDSNKLLELFDSFYAMPYGHVESQMYDAINSDRLSRFLFAGNSLKFKPNATLNFATSFQFDLHDLRKTEIDDSIDTLRKQNQTLINYRALDLVDLSHSWSSWKITFDLARSNQRFSQRIPSKVIQSESKFFTLS